MVGVSRLLPHTPPFDACRGGTHLPAKKEGPEKALPLAEITRRAWKTDDSIPTEIHKTKQDLKNGFVGADVAPAVARCNADVAQDRPSVRRAEHPGHKHRLSL
jgi:hypothetical protein